MKFLNYLIGSILATTPLLADENADGWYPVEHQQTSPTDGEETDPSIWVVFSKQLGEEKILVRLPDDPAYQLTPTGIFEITSSKEEEIFQIKAQEKGEISRRVEEILALPEAAIISLDRKSEQQLDLLYRLGGKWIQEHLIETPHHLYSLQTSSAEPDSENHLQFINSFRIEKTF